uniref:Indoleacetamide hydrolase n=1 Tax=Chelativorans sp. (strain BNC1) TaxID=266779 RepID=Q11FZ1_CHESB
MHYHDIIGIGELIRTRAISPIELVETIVARIKGIDPVLKSYAEVFEEHARRSAVNAEAEISRGNYRGPLHGIPVALKDLIFAKYGPTKCGMTIYRDFVPTSNATVVTRLEAAGAIIVGKLNMTEGALSGHHPLLDTPSNPWGANLWTGASSSGAGSATAAGLCFASIGSDSGGSIRLPAAANGLTGLKPTWGLISRNGVFPLAETLDHIGPIARSAEDIAVVLSAIAGEDTEDPTSLRQPAQDYLSLARQPIRGLRIGVDEAFAFDGVDPQVSGALQDALSVFARLGAHLRVMKFPSTADVVRHWRTICFSECAVAHSDTYPARKNEYGHDLADRIEYGRSLSATDLAKALHYLAKIRGPVQKAMDECDVFITPAMSSPVPEVSVDSSSSDRMRYMAIFNLTGHPALSFNGGFDIRQAPIGLQLVGEHLGEAVLLRVVHAFQTETGWHLQRPAGFP